MASLSDRSLLAALLLALVSCCCGADFDIRSYGAVGDGQTLDTAAIERALAAAEADGGGRVLVPAASHADANLDLDPNANAGAAVYLSGTLHMRSNVELHVEKGATLLASPRCVRGAKGPVCKQAGGTRADRPTRRSAAGEHS